MIKLEHVVLPSPEQMEFVIEGMRNPMNSWDKSDSFCIDDCLACPDRLKCPREMISMGGMPYRGGDYIGPNDLTLMQKLSNNGPVHRKYMRMMPVMVRITAPLYWWKEFDTYKVGTVANSCSTMHKITEKEFTLDDFSCEHLYMDSKETLEDVVILINKARAYFLEIERKLKENKLTDNERKELEYGKKNYWWQMIQLLPSSYNQTRNVMLNYETLANIYEWRHNHKLDEWVIFCKWIEDLPYSELITGGEKE